MSEDADQSSKTEEPTSKKLSEAQERGSVASSRELNTWMMLLAGGIVLVIAAPTIADGLKISLLKFVEQPHDILLDSRSIGPLMTEVLLDLLRLLAFPFVLFVVVALASGMVQNGFRFSPKALEPKFDKFNPIQGAKRLMSTRQIVEFVKGILKIVIVGSVATLPLLPTFRRIDTLPTYDVASLPGQLYHLVLLLLTGVLAVLAVIAVIDLLYQRWEHRKQLRMTKQEVKDEHKSTEGDPAIRQRLRKVRMERAQRRMMQAVPDADVVVTNPTHFAVAMKYDPEQMEAPRVVAKGQDLIALRIREIAEENDITIVENKPLAQALFFNVEIGQEIPEEHYKTVAEVISYVWNVKGRSMPGRATAGAAAG